MVIASGLATAAVTIGGAAVAANQQKKASNAANQAILEQEQRAQAFLAQGQAKAVGAQKAGIKAVDKGFKGALASAAVAGEATKGQILRREKQAQGAARASAANRGLGSSTLAQNLQRGVTADTSQAIASVDEAVAGLVSQIQQNRANSMLQAQQGLASIYRGFAPQQASFAMENTIQAANVGGSIAAATGSLAELIAKYGTTT